MKIRSLTYLPPPNTQKWVARHKAAIVTAISSGELTIEEACHRYQMLEEELFAWQRAFENYGILGLRAGYAQQSRSVHRKAPLTNKQGAAARRASKGE